jgi:hypothetical protein
MNDVVEVRLPIDAVDQSATDLSAWKSGESIKTNLATINFDAILSSAKTMLKKLKWKRY